MKRQKQILISVFISVLLYCLAFSSAVAAEKYNCAKDKHTFVIVLQENPTGTKSGIIVYKCTNCGFGYTDHIPELDHKWGEWIVEKEATCIEEGRRYRDCNLYATHSEYEDIPKAEHDYQQIIQEPSDTGQGIIVYTCTVCGDTYTEEYTLPHQHEYAQTVVRQPTCTEDGIKVFICIHDEDEYSDSIPMTGHKFGMWIDATIGDGKVEKSRYRKCTVCGEYEEMILPKEKEPLFNQNDVIINTVNLGLIGFFSVVTAPYINATRWYNKRRRLFLKGR